MPLPFSDYRASENTSTRLLRTAVLAGTALGFAQTVACADNLGLAANYNAFIFGTDSSSGGSSQGPIAIGTNATLVFDNVATSLTSGTNLIVGGDLTFIGGSINGDAVVGGNTTMSEGGPTGDLYTGGNFVGDGGPTNGGTTYYGGTYGGTGASQYDPSITVPIDFAKEQCELTQTSDTLNSDPSSGCYTDDGGDITFISSQSGQDVFFVNDADLEGATQINFDIPTNATAVVNVYDSTGSGGTTLPDADFNYDPSTVLWNFNGFLSLNIDSFSGAILAPTADVALFGGTVDGTIVADSLNGSGQFETVGSGSTIAFAPVPSSLWAGLVLAAGLGIRRRIIAS